ncbi:MAG: hypothetical protein WD336_07595 [Trueperaceae bacterium]
MSDPRSDADEGANRRHEHRTFYRDVPVGDLRLAARRFVTTVFANRCPACAEGRVVRGRWEVASRCERCGSRFDRMEGNELIAIPLSFFLTILILLAFALLTVPRFGFFPGLMPTMALLGVGCVLLLVRPMRMLTLWFLWLLGFVHPDDLPEAGVHHRPIAPGGDVRSDPDRS